MLSGTVEGTLIEARASEEALGNCQRKCCPKRWEEVFFVEWLRGFLFWWRFHPTILKQLYTLLHYCTISCLKKPWKNTQKHPAYFSKGWNNGRSMLMSTDTYIQIQYVIYTWLYMYVCLKGTSSPRSRVGIPKLQWRFPMEATSHDLQKCFQAPRRKWSSLILGGM